MLFFPLCAVFSVPFSQLALLRHHVQPKRSDDTHEAVSDGFTALIRQLIKRLLLPLSADLIDHLISSTKSPSLLLLIPAPCIDRLLHCASLHCLVLSASGACMQPMMQVAIGCILRVCWVPASQDRTYPVPLWAYSLCLVWLLFWCHPRTLTWHPLGRCSRWSGRLYCRHVTIGAAKLQSEACHMQHKVSWQ